MKMFIKTQLMLGLTILVLNNLTICAIAEDTAQKPYSITVPNSKATIEMLPIKGGEFLMGSPGSEEERGDDEGPQVKVKIEPFWMGKFEITWDQFDPYLAEYSRYKEAKVKSLAKDQFADGVSFPTPLYAQDAIPIIDRMGRKGGFPAASMTQLNAKQYTKWLSKVTGHFYRLPTEAEWEYACRAGTTTAFSWGDDPDIAGEYGWYFDNSEMDDGEGGYRKVGQKKPNPWGLYDMHGNVAEWVIDAYSEDHYATLKEKKLSSWDKVIAWPKKLYPRVVRGGGWDSDAVDLRSARRFVSDKEWIIQDPQKPTSVWWNTETFWVGFRVVRPLTVPSKEEQLKYWDLDEEYVKFKHDAKKDRQIRVIVEKQK